MVASVIEVWIYIGEGTFRKEKKKFWRRKKPILIARLILDRRKRVSLRRRKRRKLALSVHPKPCHNKLFQNAKNKVLGTLGVIKL